MSDVRLSFPAKAEYLILARLALAGIARGVPLDDETVADLKLAITEACGNAVRHAYPAADGVVRVTITVEPDAISIVVEDDGVGVAEGASSNGPADLPEDGMGLAIIDAIADEIDLRRANGGGTALFFRKQL